MCELHQKGTLVYVQGLWGCYIVMGELNNMEGHVSTMVSAYVRSGGNQKTTRF